MMPLSSLVPNKSRKCLARATAPIKIEFSKIVNRKWALNKKVFIY